MQKVNVGASRCLCSGLAPLNNGHIMPSFLLCSLACLTSSPHHTQPLKLPARDVSGQGEMVPWQPHSWFIVEGEWGVLMLTLVRWSSTGTILLNIRVTLVSMPHYVDECVKSLYHCYVHVKINITLHAMALLHLVI